MSQYDDEFLRRLRATFIVEAEEHVQAMSSGLLALEKTPPAQISPKAIETIFRHAHSLKGAARAANAAEIETVCQSLESVFSEWKRQHISLVPENFDTLHGAVDLIGRLVRAVESEAAPEESKNVSTFLRQLSELAAGNTSPPPPATPEPAARVPAAAVSVEPPPTAGVRSPTGTIRISTTKLDRLLLNAEELLTVKQTTAQRAADLRSFESLLSQWGTRWSRIQPQLRGLQGGDLAAADATALAEFLDWNFGCVKSVENKLLSLAKAAAQDRHDAARRVDELLAETKRLVMLPFSTLSDFFPKLVRDLGREQGKDVTFVVHGGDVEIDKRILEEMKDALVHLARNAIDHGIETPERRVKAGKPAGATLTLSAATANGNKLEITVSDDGGGIDLARVKEAAVKRGMITAEDASALDDRRAIDLIFQSDVSTSPIITEISGRGLGLAIVREKTEKLGGRLVVETTAGAGTVFRIGLPLTLATFRGILVCASGETFVVPTIHVERVTRVKIDDIKTVKNRETITLTNRAVSLARLDEVLELPPRAAHDTAPAFISVVLIGTGDEQIAFAVDDVLHDEEVLVKNLRPPLSRVRNIAGATVLASGRLALILNTADLLKSARRTTGTRRALPPTPPSGRAAPKTILMAEDSITSRMLLKGIFEAAGYRVKTAVDGLEAWTMLRTEDFDLVVSDVEMPRMDGFDLTAHIRADKKLAEKPVVLITALASREHRERGIDVGANAYVVKSSFDQGNLLNVIRRLA